MVFAGLAEMGGFSGRALALVFTILLIGPAMDVGAASQGFADVASADVEALLSVFAGNPRVVDATFEPKTIAVETEDLYFLADVHLGEFSGLRAAPFGSGNPIVRIATRGGGALADIGDAYDPDNTVKLLVGKGLIVAYSSDLAFMAAFAAARSSSPGRPPAAGDEIEFQGARGTIKATVTGALWVDLGESRYLVNSHGALWSQLSGSDAAYEAQAEATRRVSDSQFTVKSSRVPTDAQLRLVGTGMKTDAGRGAVMFSAKESSFSFNEALAATAHEGEVAFSNQPRIDPELDFWANQDIEALTQYILIEGAKDADQQLELTVEEMRKVQEEKRKLAAQLVDKRPHVSSTGIGRLAASSAMQAKVNADEKAIQDADEARKTGDDIQAKELAQRREAIQNFTRKMNDVKDSLGKM